MGDFWKTAGGVGVLGRNRRGIFTTDFAFVSALLLPPSCHLSTPPPVPPSISIPIPIPTLPSSSIYLLINSLKQLPSSPFYYYFFNSCYLKNLVFNLEREPFWENQRFQDNRGIHHNGSQLIWWKASRGSGQVVRNDPYFTVCVDVSG